MSRGCEGSISSVDSARLGRLGVITSQSLLMLISPASCTNKTRKCFSDALEGSEGLTPSSEACQAESEATTSTSLPLLTRVGSKRR
jgi:hypothetical protein